MTDCIQLQDLSLFYIGDNALITPQATNAAVNMLNIDVDGRYNQNFDIDCNFWDIVENMDIRFLLECS